MIRMALHQASYDLRAFIRNRQSQFFTLALPVLFLVIFASIFGGRGRTVPVAGGRIFPVRHLADALLAAYNPHTTGLGFAGLDLLIVAAWGAAGLLIALRTFSRLPPGR